MSGIYNRFFYNLMAGVIDLVNDTIKIALMDNNHSFVTGNNVWGDVSANEIIGVGYTAGGETLTNKTVTQGDPTKFDANDVSWENATIDAYHAVLYDTTVSDNLIASFDFGGSQSVEDGYFDIQWNASGIITLAD